MIDRIRLGWFCGGMKQLSILITLLISLGLSSTCWGKVFKSLKVPNYKNIQVLVEDVHENSVGITSENIETAAKLKLLRNGVKLTPLSNPYIYVSINVVDVTLGARVLGVAYNIIIGLSKYDIEKGYTYTPLDSSISAIGLSTNLEDFRAYLDNCLDKFILNYLESNME